MSPWQNIGGETLSVPPRLPSSLSTPQTFNSPIKRTAGVRDLTFYPSFPFFDRWIWLGRVRVGARTAPYYSGVIASS